MVNLKNKIKIINSLPEEKKEFPIDKLIGILIFLIILIPSIYFSYIKLLPYIKSVNIDKIKGKKVFLTECNTKDYVIINKDKSYTLSITDNDCNSKYYEGDIFIKYNEITFNKDLSGTIDDNYNIIINNNTFESEK